MRSCRGPAGRVLFAGAEGARSLLADELAADVVVALPDHGRFRPRVPEGDLAVVASPSAALLARGCQSGAACRFDRPGDDAPPRGPPACGCAAEAETPDLEGLVAAVAASE